MDYLSRVKNHRAVYERILVPNKCQLCSKNRSIFNEQGREKHYSPTDLNLLELIDSLQKIFLGRQDSNLRMAAPKAAAL